MRLPSSSSIRADKIRRQKLSSEVHNNVRVIIEEVRRDTTRKDNFRILVIGRQVYLNQEEIPLKWLSIASRFEEFTHLFHKTLNDALLKEGFYLLASENDAFIYKPSENKPEAIVV